MTHEFRFGNRSVQTCRLLAAHVFLFALFGAAAPLVASVQSEILYSRGLVALQAENYSEAFDLFDRAVQADPRDASALFYRGLTRGRMKDYQGAITDLGAALEKNPGLREAALELGIALVQSGRYREAIPWLQRAREADDLKAQASLFLGIAQLRLGELDLARQEFQIAAEGDAKLRGPATYYQGIIAFQQRRYTDAETLFEEVAREQPGTDMGKESTAFLAVISRRTRPYYVYGRLGLEYDSNVALAPGDNTVNTALGISDEADGRVMIGVGGLYHVLREDNARVSLGYDFFQGLQFRLTDFNLMDNRFHVEGLRRWGIVELGGFASYDYYIRDNDSFLGQVNTSTLITLNETEHAATTLLYRFRFNDYKERPFGETLSGAYHTGGFRQFFYLGAPTRYVLLGYQYETQGTSHDAGAAYEYDGNVIEAGFAWNFPWSVDLQALYAYHRDDYAAASEGRIDDEHQGVLVITKPLLDFLTIGASFYADVDDSEKKEFTYDRYVGSIFAEVSY